MRVELELLTVGHTVHLEAAAIRGGRLAEIRFPSTVALIQHPREGVVLFDTGYADWFFRATARWPERLYAKLTPVTLAPEARLEAQLAARGVALDDVRTCVLSHFHADHVAGARDLPRARFVFADEAHRAVATQGRLGRLFSGFLATLLPEDFRQRSLALDSVELRRDRVPELGPLGRGHDLFGDGTLTLIPLPGHARGHCGLHVRARGGDAFLLGDAVWLTDAIHARRAPGWLTQRLLRNGDPAAYEETLHRLADLAQTERALRLVPCHCEHGTAPLHRAPAAPFTPTERLPA